jgi:hypothetical protein
MTCTTPSSLVGIFMQFLKGIFDTLRVYVPAISYGPKGFPGYPTGVDQQELQLPQGQTGTSSGEQEMPWM